METQEVSRREVVVIGGKDKTYKLCLRCGKLKPVSEFHRSNTVYGGLVAHCKKCRQRTRLTTGGKRYIGLSKRPYPLNGKCEICNIELDQYDYHHWDDNNLSLGIWVCKSCDYLAEGIDEIDKNPWKVDIYRRLKEEVEEAEETFSYSGPYSPSNGIYKLFLNNKQTYKWCPRCGEMLPVEEFSKNRHGWDGLAGWCKECKRGSRLGYRGGGRFYGLHKRPKSDSCELCNGETNLHYHHWDDNNKSKGIWVCQSNMCHNLAEAVDMLDSGSLLPKKYYELKQV